MVDRYRVEEDGDLWSPQHDEAERGEYVRAADYDALAAELAMVKEQYASYREAAGASIGVDLNQQAIERISVLETQLHCSARILSCMPLDSTVRCGSESKAMKKQSKAMKKPGDMVLILRRTPDGSEPGWSRNIKPGMQGVVLTKPKKLTVNSWDAACLVQVGEHQEYIAQSLLQTTEDILIDLAEKLNGNV